MTKRIADLAGPTPYTGEDSQVEADRAQTEPHPDTSDTTQPRPDYTVAPEKEPETYNWVMTGTHVSVGQDEHGVQFDGMNHGDFSRPYAYGKLHLHYRWDAIWEITYTNMALAQVEKRLKRYTTDTGWHFAGIVDSQGLPFAMRGVKQARLSRYEKVSEGVGIGEQNVGIRDWHNKEWGDMQDHDNVDPTHIEKYYGEQDYPDEGDPFGLYVCDDCNYHAVGYDDYRKHVLRDHLDKGKPPTEPRPVVDLDQALPAHFNQDIMDPTVMRQSNFYKIAAATMPMIPGPMPFIYDIETDRIFVGHPGERHSDIQGRFTPGGIVEGLYMPDGKVQIKTDTDMPYTVRHLIELWYAMHPELQVKGIFLLVGDKKYKLASANIAHKVRNLVATEPAAWAAYQALEPLGNVYVVGGAVRDVILGKQPKDFDLMAQGIPEHEILESLSQLPGRVDMTGEQFGVIRYRDPDGSEVEIALPRTERSTGPGHKDFEVYTDPYISVGQDLARRDFTGNAMAVNLSTGDLIDPYHGSEHLKAGELHTVSDRSFVEDPLRILRALAQVSKHKLDPTPEVYHQMRANAASLRELPAERIQAELDKIMAGGDPMKALRLAEATGVLHEILPEVAETINFDQKNPHHNLPLHEHLYEVMHNLAQQSDDPDLRMVGLLHDIGKPASQWVGEDGVGHYYRNEFEQGQNHEEVGAEMAGDILKRLKYPNDRIDRITHLIRHHMFAPFSSQGGARKFINRVGDQHADDLLAFRRADQEGKGTDEADSPVDLMQGYVNRVREMGEPTDVSMLAINGHDLLQMGMKPGPLMGQTLRYLTDIVLERPDMNDRDTLLPMALNYWKNTEAGIESPTASVKFFGTKTLQSNILDEIHPGLDPDVFVRADDIDPDVKLPIITWVKNTVYTIMKDAGWPDPANYLKLILTGSLTTYQYSEHSDFDVSLWVDAERFPDWVRSDLIALMIERAEGLNVPGTTHPLQAFVVDSVRYKPSDLYKPGLRSAYDLDERRWIVLPEHERSKDVYKTYPGIVAYAREVCSMFRLLLRFGNDTAVKILWDRLHKKRMLDQRAGMGDYTESNIVYKMIANDGLEPLIAEATGEHIA